MITIYLVNKNNYIRNLEADISQCYSDFNKKYNSDYYFSKRNYHKWKKGYTKLIPKIYIVNTHIKRIEAVAKRFGPLDKLIMLYFSYFIIKKEYSDKVKHLVHIIENGYEVLKDRNTKYVEKEKELFSELFSSVDGKQLTDQQMDSVIVDEASNLVIAGAGTGKTLYVRGKCPQNP